MKTENDLKKTQKNLFRIMSMDGLGDLTISLAFMALGSQIYFDSMMFFFIIPMIVPIMVILKKKVIFPRFGYFKPENTSSSTRLDVNPVLAYSFVAFLFIAMGLGAMKAFGMNLPAIIEDNFLIILGLIFVIPTYWGAAFTGIKRIYLYATVVLALFIHGSITEYSTVNGKDLVREALGMHIMIFGAVVLIFGTVLFIRFLIHYPVAEDSENEI